MIYGFMSGMMMGGGGVPELKGFTTGNSTGSPMTVDIPTEAKVGDILLIVIAKANNSSAVTITNPSGWTQLWNDAGSGFLRRSFGTYRVVTGSEGSSVNVTISATGAGSYICAVVGAPNSTIQATASVLATTASPNPPSITMPSIADTLFVACAVAGPTTVTVSSPPAGYGDTIFSTLVTGTTASVALSFKRATADIEDPGTFTLSASTSTIANTVGIR